MASGASGSGNVEKKVGELEKIIATPIAGTTEEAKKNAAAAATTTTTTTNASAAAASPPATTTVGSSIGQGGFCSGVKSCVTGDYGRCAATGAVIIVFIFGLLKCVLGEDDEDRESLLEKDEEEKEKEEKVKEDYLNYSRMSAM